MSDFEWQTDEEWQDEVIVAAETQRSWWGWLTAGGIALIVGGMVWLQLRGRVQETVQEVEQEVIASFELLYSAIQTGDTELAYTLLSGSDADWTKQEQAKIDSAEWLQWPELGWQLVEEPTVSQVVTGGDLRSAELTLSLHYQFNKTFFTLQRTLSFRQGETHWLYAPHKPDYWGEDRLTENSPDDPLQLAFIYQARDAELLALLHTDIIKKHQLFWQQYTPNAVHTFKPAIVIFHEQSQTFSHLLPSLSETTSVTLPTPSTIGTPVDELGYQQLLVAYSNYLLTFFAAAEVDYFCCQHTVFGQALGEYLLAKENFQVVELTAHDYSRVLQGNGGFDERLLGWVSSRPTAPTTDEWRTARAVVEYIHKTIPLHAVSTQMGRGLNSLTSFDEWLQLIAQTRLLSSVILDNGAETEPTFAGFQAFLIERGAAAADDAPYPLPTAQPVVACLKDSHGSRLYAYDFGSYAWETLWETSEPISQLDALEAPDTLWIKQGNTLSGVWQSGQFTQQTATLVNYSAEWQTPNTPPVVMRQSLGDDEATNNFYWLDPNECDVGQAMQLTGCELTPLDGIPHWSPKRAYILFADHVRGKLTLTDAALNILQTRTDIAQLETIIWIDDTHYSWRNPIDEAHYRSSVERIETEQWFTNTNLNLVTPLADQQLDPNLYIYPASTPDDPYLLMLQIYEGTVPQHLFSYNHVTGDMRYLGKISYHEYLSMSPEGRYVLTVRARPSTVMRLNTSINLLNRENDAFYRYEYGEPAAFSDDWLLLSDSDKLRLLAPSERYERLIPLPADDCTDAVWLSQE